jgi:hypothetical protein
MECREAGGRGAFEQASVLRFHRRDRRVAVLVSGEV